MMAQRLSRLALATARTAVGRPMRSGFAPLAAADLHLWKKKSAAARDPYLHVFALDSP